tara:strand:+ start:3121 stop:5565 length:2445 start_codon:yes stop_codon:yes gene_type:complete
MAVGDIPESIYRNTLDLNRFSTGTARKLVRAYDRIINDAIDQLAKIERMPRAKQPKYKADRLRSLIKQLQQSLNSWSHKSAASMIKDLDGIARLQGEFAELQLAKALPIGTESVINPLNITKGYAESVVNSNPIDLNASLLSDDLKAKVKGLPEKFSLTSKQGSLVNLPNGQSLSQSFRGLAAKQAELFGRTVRDGMLTGEPTPQIARRLRDQLIFEDGKPYKPNQVTNLVRTSVQQVSNDAAQAVYANNQDITKEYRWVATLDSRTAPECQILDQQKFKYGQGPQPPQHFGCRCRTVAVIDYGDDWQPKIGKRASEFGSVPRGTSYGKFLKDQSASYKAKVLGKNKVKYFNALTKKYGPDQALKKMVRTDGQSKTLKQLQKTYGKQPNKTIKKSVPKKTKLVTDKDKKLAAEIAELEKQNAALLKKIGADPKSISALSKQIAKDQTKNISQAGVNIKKLSEEISQIGKKPKPKIKKPSAALIKKEGQYMTAAQKAGKQKYVPLTPAQKKLIDDSVAEKLGIEKKYDLLTKKVASIKNREEYIKQSRENEAKIRKLKSEFKKATDKKILNNDYAYFGEDFVGDKWVKVDNKRITDMGYKVDNKMLDGTKKKGWSSKFEQLEEYISSWKGGSASTQMAQCWQLEQSGAKLSTFAQYKAKSFKKMSSATRNSFLNQADGLEDFIKRSPAYDGQIQRGMKIRKDRFDEFLQDLATGKPTATLESWSSKTDIADEFAGIKRIKGKIGPDSDFDTERIHTMLTVKKNKYGSSITNLASDYQHEMEVLVPSKLRYKISDIEQIPIGDTGEMFWNIILEQI